MVEINEQHNGNDVASIINDGLSGVGTSVSIGDESGRSASEKLNGVFDDDVLNESMSGSEWTNAVADAIENLDVEHDVLRMLHISDTHGYTAALEQCRAMLSADSGISHIIITGDLTQYGTSIYTADTLSNLEAIKALGDRLLLLKGNHDAIDNAHNNLSGVTDIENYSASSGALINIKKFEKALMGKTINGVFTPHVTFAYPSVSNAACYWHKDIEIGKHTLRIIAIDDYETSSKFNNTYYVSYRQEQATWLINLLADTPSTYHILMLTHEPPCKSYGNNSYAQSMRPKPTDTEQERIQKLFVSENHYYWHERNGEVDNWLPIVMEAYLHKKNLNTTWANKNTNFPTLQLVKDYSQNNPATLVGWAFGHLHNDVIGWMPYPSNGYDDQLLLGICAGDSGVKWAYYDDLLCDYTGNEGQGQRYATSEPSYRINELVIDLTACKITIKRYGNMTTAINSKSDGSGTQRPYGGRVRDSVTFHLNKKID